MLGLNEKCLLFLEISSKLGDPMCFSFKKHVTIWSLGWKSRGQAQQDPMWDRQTTATAGTGGERMRGAADTRPFWRTLASTPEALEPQKPWSLSSSNSTSKQGYLCSTTVICLLHVPNSTSCFWDPGCVLHSLLQVPYLFTPFHSSHPILLTHSASFNST